MGLFLSCAILRKLIKPRGDLASKSETWEIMSGKKRILVIEDEMPVALMMVFLLSRVGYDVTTAHNGKKGIELASATRFDVITLDMDLPDIHGFEICHELKQRHVSRNTPIIFITGRHLKKIGSTPLNLARWITSRNHLKRVNSFFASPPKSETGSKM
jgi:CheY-like chemotaxis protein